MGSNRGILTIMQVVEQYEHDYQLSIDHRENLSLTLRSFPTLWHMT